MAGAGRACADGTVGRGSAERGRDFFWLTGNSFRFDRLLGTCVADGVASRGRSIGLAWPGCFGGAARIHFRREWAGASAAGRDFARRCGGAWPLAAAIGRQLRVVGIAAGGVAAISTGLVSWFGFGLSGDPLNATWIYAIYGVATCAAAVLGQRGGVARSKFAAMLAWIGAGLTLAACVQGVVYMAAAHWSLALPWATALMLEATILCIATAGARKWFGLPGTNRAAGAFGAAGVLVSVAALVLIAGGSIGTPYHVSAGPLAIHWIWLAAVWLAVALAESLPSVLFPASQAALAVAVWFCVGIWLEPRPWFVAAEYPWLDPWTLQAEGIALRRCAWLRWMCGDSCKSIGWRRCSRRACPSM